MAVHGPNEDDSAYNKDPFWENLTVVTEEAEGRIYIAGNFNSNVGIRDEIYRTAIGEHEEIVRNNNGERMLDFCMMHDLIVTDTFFEHKDINKYTREVKSRGEKSIIDYILVERNNRKQVCN